jgi:hypothetical protein
LYALGEIILYTTIVSPRYAQLGKEYLAENTCTFTIKHICRHSLLKKAGELKITTLGRSWRAFHTLKSLPW